MKVSARKLTAGVAVIVIAAAVVAGLMITGSPREQRLARFDERRVTDLSSLSNSLSRHYLETGELPETLTELMDGRIRSSLPRDPVTDRSYGYEFTGPRRFELCAEFARASPASMEDEFWAHPAGRECFEFDFGDLRLP